MVEDMFDTYYKSHKLLKSLTNENNSSLDPSLKLYINNINASMMRIKVIVDQMSYMDTILKLKGKDKETLIKIQETLKNVEGALMDVHSALAYPFEYFNQF